jgi:hypothetical protein
MVTVSPVTNAAVPLSVTVVPTPSVNETLAPSENEPPA